ncbi:MAG: response regulator [Deltaproteobacteria bacterium]|nr:response regulator [Deltaproteobacteria bacterium]
MTAPWRVLLVEDSPTDAKLVVHELRRGGRVVEFERVDTAAAMREALARSPWDVVLSDWSMPTFTAPAARAILREQGLDLPFIIVSGTIGEETAVEAMRAGADDFVLKDKLARLTPAIERGLRECAERAARHAAEAALRTSEARFRRLADSGIIGILTSDVNGVILEANGAYLDLLGFTRDDLASGALHWEALTPPEYAQIAERSLRQLQVTGVATPWEMETFRKDGTRVPVLVGAAMLEFPNIIAFVADLTERKRAEAGRIAAEESLRKSEEQLRHAQKMEAVGRLAGGVAHDFNNVLTVIMGYGDLILADLKQTDPLREDIEAIQTAAARAGRLTHQLLMFSRQQPMEAKVVDLNDVLVDMDRMLQRILGEDVELVAVPPKTSGRVRVDPSHIEQVILNLVVNARDAMPTGGKLTIETANVELDEAYARAHLPAVAGPHVMLAVTDTGCGMDAETQARIFEPFFTTKGQGHGTGLGLSTVFGIVQQSGGSIWVYSEPGQGTSFKVYLPRVDAEVDTATAEPAPTTLRGDETILLVEDEAQVRAIVLNILRRQGYHVLVAQHAGEALLLAERHAGAIDLLLTDVVMPHMGGPELATRLAGLQPAMKVLCMSGYTDESIVRHGVLDGGIAFVQKPLTPDSLARKVREVLEGHRVPRTTGHIEVIP